MLFCLVFSIAFLGCVDGHLKAESLLVSSVDSGAFSVTRSIALDGTKEGFFADSRNSEDIRLYPATHKISANTASDPDYTESSYTISGTSSGKCSLDGDILGSLTYQLDLNFSVAIPLGLYLDPTHTYAIYVDFVDINGIAYNASGAQYNPISCSGINCVASVGSKTAVMGESWHGSLGGDGFTGSIVTLLIDASYVCGVDSQGDTFTFGFSSNNVNVKVYDFGESNSSDIIDAIDSGTSAQDKGNQLQQEANETSKSIFDKISDFFGSFFENIINALKSLFVPEDGYFSDFFERLNDFFSEKLGMLYAPIDLFVDVLTSIQNASSVSSGIGFPEIKWGDTVLIESQTINLQMYADEFPDLQEKLYFATDVIMIGAVLGLLQHKFREVMNT